MKRPLGAQGAGPEYVAYQGVFMKVVSLYPSKSGEPASLSGARLVAALDIGSSKISCMIGEVRGLKRRSGGAVPAARITGFGVQAARGVRGGVVVDATAAEQAVRLAVDAAERMAGVRLEEVHVNISGGQPKCETVQAEISIDGGGPVGARHVARVIGQALGRCRAQDGREIVHVTAARFSLDGGPGLLKAEGLHADRLRADVNVISLQRGVLRNLEMVIERCMLRPAGFVIAPYAAARAVAVADELELGVTVVEIGAANTTWAAFEDGRLEAAGAIPVGSGHVTNDIAMLLGVPLKEAERLKTLDGSVLPGIGDDNDAISASMLGEMGAGAMQQLPRSMLDKVIRARMEEILEMTRDALRACPARTAGHRLVLTGGGSQLVGLRELAEQIFGAPVRIGQPRQIAGMPQVMETAAFAGVAGLLRAAMEPDDLGFLPAHEAMAGAELETGTGGYFSRVRQWFGQSF